MSKRKPSCRFSCIVPGCHITSLSKEKITTLHNIPRNETLRNTWFSNLGIPNFQVQTTSVVCSRHFSNESYEQDVEFLARLGYKENIRRTLKKNASPSIFSVTLPTLEVFSSTSSSLISSEAGASGSRSVLTSETCPSTSTSLPPTEAFVSRPTSSSLSTSQAFVSTLNVFKKHQLEYDSDFMPMAVKRARLQDVQEFSECNMATSIGIQCFIPPLTKTKKVQFIAIPKCRSIGTQISSNFCCSKSVKTQTRNVRITEYHATRNYLFENTTEEPNYFYGIRGSTQIMEKLRLYQLGNQESVKSL